MSSIAERIRTFVDNRIIPHENELIEPSADPTEPYRETALFDELRQAAKAEGLWNLQFTDPSAKVARTQAEFFDIAIETGRSRLAPLIMNSTGPDSGNMDLLREYGTEAQKQQWLSQLEAGAIRSCFAMTEPDVASSDARNISADIEVVGDRLKINGRKWWITQAAHHNCAIAFVVGKVRAPGEDYDGKHTMVLVPMDTPGVRVVRRLTVFGYLDDHAELVFDDVEVPKSNVLGQLGEGFKMAQERLIGARLQHCMRIVGLAERALEIMIARSRTRTAFGNRLDHYDTLRDAVAESRIDIETMRGLIERVVQRVDSEGWLAATVNVSMVKIHIPRAALRVIDRAIQVCGGAGVSDEFPLAVLFAHARTLRIADGPDDVHKSVIARREMGKKSDHV